MRQLRHCAKGCVLCVAVLRHFGLVILSTNIQFLNIGMENCVTFLGLLCCIVSKLGTFFC